MSKILSALVCAVVLFTGCNVVPKEKTTSTAQQASDNFNNKQADKLRQVITGRMQPPPTIPQANNPTTVTVSGSNNVVAVQPPEEKEPVKHQPDYSGAARIRGSDGRIYYVVGVRGEAPPTETIEYESQAGQTSQSSESSNRFDTSSIPFAVKLVIGGVGLFIIGGFVYFAVKYFKTTAAGAVAMRVADEGLASIGHDLEQKLQASRDANEQAQLAQQLAKVEKQRGKLALRRPVPKT